MRIAKTIAEARAAIAELRAAGRTVGLVPTMGALHAGHLSLVRAARAACGAVVVSLFVNPTQFGPNEDFSKYPRTFDADCEMLRGEGVEVLFAPAAEEMYAPGAVTFVDVEEISGRLDGESRPGHFRGVATVVAKLFNIVGPDQAFFGQKDAAQVAVLRRMVRDLNFGLELVVCPIVREPDGLAMSSRNRYLSADDRRHALVLHRALRRMEELADAGQTASDELVEAGRAVMAGEPAAQLDYLRIVDPETLEDVSDVGRGALAAVAAWVGPARLIDNVLLPPR
ncbi:MAG: pantoate--beta-alanine ligase [Acidobacteriota bacterium]